MPLPLHRLRLRDRWRAVRAWSAAHWARVQPIVGRAAAAPWRAVALGASGVAAALVATVILFFTFADWDALKGPIGRWASNAAGREIVIRGQLDVNPWSWTPDIVVTDLVIGNPARYRERGELAQIGRAEASIRWLPLLIGRFDFVRLDLTGADISLYRDEQGVSNWSATPRRNAEPLDLPAIRQFSLRNGRIRYQDDRRNLILEASFATDESVYPRNEGRFELSGEGRINRRPFSLSLTGAPLLNVRRGAPYRFNADVRAGPTRIVAAGAISRPFDLSAWRADVRATGHDLADLYPLIGLTLPNTPPYALEGRAERGGGSYRMADLSGHIGDSDISGAFTASRRGGRLFLEGGFHSDRLDFDDLLSVLGGPPEADETASPEQRALAAQMEAQSRLLPDAQLDISRVRNMDAQVSYRAARVSDAPVPLRSFALDIALDRGLLRLDPVELHLVQGRVAGAVSIDARENTPRVHMDVRLANARMEHIFRVGERAALSGRLMGRARLSGAGASVREAAANASGDVTLVSPQGEVREAFAELTGINVTRGLGLLLSDDQSMIGLRCGVASFQVRRGVAHAHSIVFDTETMLIRGGGTMNLRDERLDLEIEGEPKEPRLVSVSAPISVGGSLRAPRVGVEAEDALAQTGLAALLATVAAPLAAVLPFVDAGLAEDANCGALLAARAAPAREG